MLFIRQGTKLYSLEPFSQKSVKKYVTRIYDIVLCDNRLFQIQKVHPTDLILGVRDLKNPKDYGLVNPIKFKENLQMVYCPVDVTPLMELFNDENIINLDDSFILPGDEGYCNYTYCQVSKALAIIPNSEIASVRFNRKEYWKLIKYTIEVEL